MNLILRNKDLIFDYFKDVFYIYLVLQSVLACFVVIMNHYIRFLYYIRSRILVQFKIVHCGNLPCLNMLKT